MTQIQHGLEVFFLYAMPLDGVKYLGLCSLLQLPVSRDSEAHLNINLNVAK